MNIIHSILINIIFPNTADALTLGNLIADVNRVIINPAIIALFSIALFLFMYGVVVFISNRDSGSQDANTGKKHMIWGIIGMAIMLSAFGAVQWIANTLDVKGVDVQNTPASTS